jgi:hypothetical protein
MLDSHDMLCQAAIAAEAKHVVALHIDAVQSYNSCVQVEVAIRSAEIAADNTSMTDIPRYLLALQRHLEVLALKYK